MQFSWFVPKAEPKREPRVTKNSSFSDKLAPTVDERTALAAQELLENAAFQRAFDRLRKEAMSVFATSASGVDGLHQREIAHTKIRALDEIEASLTAMRDELKLHRNRDKVV